MRILVVPLYLCDTSCPSSSVGLMCWTTVQQHRRNHQYIPPSWTRRGLWATAWTAINNLQICECRCDNSLFARWRRLCSRYLLAIKAIYYITIKLYSASPLVTDAFKCHLFPLTYFRYHNAVVVIVVVPSATNNRTTPSATQSHPRWFPAMGISQHTEYFQC